MSCVFPGSTDPVLGYAPASQSSSISSPTIVPLRHRVEGNLEGEPAPLHRREVETAWLHEAHGTAETPRGRAGDDVWGDTADRLAAEGAADVGRDHAEEVGRETERPRELDSAPVRCLCRRVHREPAVGLGHREDRAPLHGCHRHPRDRERRTDGELGGGEGVGGRGRIPHERDLVRLARVVDRWKRVVLDVDELDRVLRHRRALGDDRRDVLAHVPHFAVGECGLGELLRDERDLVDGLGREVARREDRDDARLDRRGSGVEVHDACTRHWRCHEREHERRRRRADRP